VDDNEEGFLAFIDNFPQDCADYFATAIERSFPHVETSIEMATDWRFLCRIIVPHDQEGIATIEKVCFDLQTKMLFELHILTAYIVEREDVNA